MASEYLPLSVASERGNTKNLSPRRSDVTYCRRVFKRLHLATLRLLRWTWKSTPVF